ncbi:MAG: rhodanese-like domain-containing protein [Silicimonas sp.]|nr:rhodanese-like domain-containing protein [Silicimonas sp.]
MKTAEDYLEEAHGAVPKISTEEGIAKHGSGTVFVDVRDANSIAESGTIAGAVRAPRGMIEFLADPATDFHIPTMQKDADLVLICGAGGQAALAGKTLKDMGYQNVSNVGGFAAWKDAGGPVET